QAPGYEDLRKAKYRSRPRRYDRDKLHHEAPEKAPLHPSLYFLKKPSGADERYGSVIALFPLPFLANEYHRAPISDPIARHAAGKVPHSQELLAATGGLRRPAGIWPDHGM